MDRKKIVGFFALVILVASIYPGTLFFLERSYGDLGNIDVIAYYVPWIFHLMLIEFNVIVGVLAFGLWILFNVAGSVEEEPPAVHPKKKQATKKKPSRKNHEHPKPKAPEKSAEKPGEPQITVVNVAEKPAEEKVEAPKEWEEEEFE